MIDCSIGQQCCCHLLIEQQLHETCLVAVKAVTLKALEEVAGRLRDRKLPVRKEAAQKLMALFR